MKKQSWVKAHWKTCLGVTLILVSVVVLLVSTGVFRTPVALDQATLKDFTIVAGPGNQEQALAIYTYIAQETGVLLPVTENTDFAKDHAIYVGTRDFNSYGGYRYRISTQTNGKLAAIYIDGSGEALIGGAKALVEQSQKNKNNAFPFGIEQEQIGYEWNTTDTTMTGLGFQLNKIETTELAEGVSLLEMKYKSLAMGKVDAQVVVVKADANAEMMVAAAPWDETNSVKNPVQLYTTGQYGQQLVDRGYEVLAISNAGYFQKQAGSNLPWGMQIVDGVVLQEPNTSEPRYTDNWVGMTKDGKYVISNTEGYNSTYKGNLQCAVGGHLVMMADGVPCHISGTPYFRTAVGINDAGDFVIVTMDKINYATLVQVFMDLDMDIKTVLNLDGGGSTTLYARDASGALKQYACGESPLERPIMDTIAFVAAE